MTTSQRSDIERWIARILRTGIVFSAGFMAVGLVLFAAQGAPGSLSGANPSAGDLLRALTDGSVHDRFSSAQLCMYLGITLLILTPFLRVLTTAIAFTVERDWKYVGTSMIVLVMLLSELFIAFH